MLKLTIPALQLFDDDTQTFSYTKQRLIVLEHSLISLSKWEAKWNKPLLSNTPKTREETLDYIKCMTITQNVPDEVYTYLPDSSIAEINDYIAKPMTATKLPRARGRNRDVITSEVIYYWMLSLNIPIEFQKKHLNTLLTLIQVCNIKNQPAKKRKSSEVSAEYSRLNALRRKQYGSKG